MFLTHYTFIHHSLNRNTLQCVYRWHKSIYQYLGYKLILPHTANNACVHFRQSTVRLGLFKMLSYAWLLYSSTCIQVGLLSHGYTRNNATSYSDFVKVTTSIILKNLSHSTSPYQNAILMLSATNATTSINNSNLHHSTSYSKNTMLSAMDAATDINYSKRDAKSPYQKTKLN